MPSSTGYLMVAIITAAGLFFVLWWMLVRAGDEAPWLPAGLAASVVLLVALSAREVVMRRAWTRYLLENGIHEPRPKSRSSQSSRSSKKGFSASVHSAALRTIQKQSAAADAPHSTPEAHLDVAQLCHEYLSGTDEAIRSGSYGSEKGIALRAGQERVRALHKHHLLTWARGQSRSLTHEAQQRARTFDKIETANRAMDCIDSALRIYPDEPELHESRVAISEFIASVKVAHWVELAERSAFKGHYRRAIDRYRDALFYLNQDVVKADVRIAGTEKIQRQIADLQGRLRHREARSNPLTGDAEAADSQQDQ
jgi:tetratricopeptide (TPR) repeat protein